MEARRGVSERARDIGGPDDHRAPVELRRRGTALDDDRAGPGGDRTGDEPACIDAPAPAREEQGPGHDLAAVVAYRRHHPVQRGGDRGVSLQERREARGGRHLPRRHAHGASSGSGTCDAAATLMPVRRLISGSSGAIPSTRNAPLTMSENTGAATAPP